jgi:hypothetical protein
VYASIQLSSLFIYKLNSAACGPITVSTNTSNRNLAAQHKEQETKTKKNESF